MKETQQHNADNVAQHVNYPKKKIIGKLIVKKGHKLFQLDTKTGVVMEAEPKVVFQIEKGGDISDTKRMDYDESGRYVYKSFLNLENAVKKFQKIVDNAARKMAIRV